MRILFVTQVRLDRPHGGARHVLAIVREWIGLGHQVCLVAPGQTDDLEGVYRLRPPEYLQPGVRMEVALSGLAGWAITRWRPDIGYVRICATTSLVPLTLASSGLPVAFELNGKLLDEQRQLGRSDGRVWLLKQWHQRVLKLGPTVAVDHLTAHHAVKEMGAIGTRVVENGADVSIATPGSRHLARRRFGLDEDTPVIGFAGTLAAELRFDLLDAALCQMSTKPLLLVAGDGAQRRFFAAKQHRYPHVRWLDSVPHEEAIDVLRASNVCINVRDGIVGMKTLEYAAVGRRFVTFKVQGTDRLERLYPGYKVAFLVNKRTPDALARALEEALAEDEMSGPLPLEKIQQAQAAVSWRQTASRLVDVFEDQI